MRGVARTFERWAIAIRHHPILVPHERTWNALRPLYERLVALLGRRGLSRTINGTDRVLILPEARGVSSVYEPEVWAAIMQWVRPGSVVVDAGAHIGLYTIAFAHRVGDAGRVIAFEPDPQTFTILQRHVQLNGVADRVELYESAVGDRDGVVSFDARGELESRIRSGGGVGMVTVPSAALDTVLAGTRVDLLKIDVEGFELRALQGASQLLNDRDRAPQAIFLEAHSYLWDELGVTDAALLGLLHSAGYKTVDISGEPVHSVNQYGEVIGLREPSPGATIDREAPRATS